MIRVVAVQGLALVQDGGRPGRMHEGVPPGGALIPVALATANRAAGNPPGAAAIEHYGRLVLDVDGHTRDFAPAGRVGYVAIAGGVDAPEILGGRGALLAAGIGRPLRAGDTFPGATVAAAAPPPDDDPIFYLPGPDADLDLPEYTISPVGDRAGIRLVGPRLHVPQPAASAPMVRGAIQMPPSGEPIVLGPDHPTTGGYPVVGVLLSADFGRFAARPPGRAVRFRRTGPGRSR